MCSALGYIDCTMPALGVFCLTVGVAFIGCCYGAGIIVNHLDIAPRYAGILFGISNTAGTIPGFMAPFLVGQVTQNVFDRQVRLLYVLGKVTRDADRCGGQIGEYAATPAESDGLHANFVGGLNRQDHI